MSKDSEVRAKPRVRGLAAVVSVTAALAVPAWAGAVNRLAAIRAAQQARPVCGMPVSGTNLFIEFPPPRPRHAGEISYNILNNFAVPKSTLNWDSLREGQRGRKRT